MSVNTQRAYGVFDFKDSEGKSRKRVEWLCVDGRYVTKPAPTLAEIFSATKAEFGGVDEADIGIFAERGRLVVTDVPEYVGIPGSDGWVEWRHERARITLSELRRVASVRFSNHSYNGLWLAAAAYPALKMGKRI